MTSDELRIARSAFAFTCLCWHSCACWRRLVDTARHTLCCALQLLAKLEDQSTASSDNPASNPLKMEASAARVNGASAASDDTRSTLHSRSLSKDSADGSAESFASSENREDERRSSLDDSHPPLAAAVDAVVSAASAAGFGASRFHAALDPSLSLTSNANALFARNANAAASPDEKKPPPLLLAQNNSPSSNNNAQSAAALLGASAAAHSACFPNPFASDAMALSGAAGHAAFDSAAAAAASSAAAYANALLQGQLHLQSLPPALPFPQLSSLQSSPPSFLNFAYPYQQQSLK